MLGSCANRKHCWEMTISFWLNGLKSTPGEKQKKHKLHVYIVDVSSGGTCFLLEMAAEREILCLPNQGYTGHKPLVRTLCLVIWLQSCSCVHSTQSTDCGSGAWCSLISILWSWVPIKVFNNSILRSSQRNICSLVEIYIPMCFFTPGIPLEYLRQIHHLFTEVQPRILKVGSNETNLHNNHPNFIPCADVKRYLGVCSPFLDRALRRSSFCYSFLLILFCKIVTQMSSVLSTMASVFKFELVPGQERILPSTG